MKSKFINAYMQVAETFAKLSSAERLKVGAIAVKDDRIISIGYNGMPSGWDNTCEDYYTMINDSGERVLESKTKPEVLHAESNCISKLARSSESGEGATMFVTHAPCIECAKLIYQSGVSAVYYKNQYRSNAGLDFLKSSGILVHQIGQQAISSPI